MPFGIFAYQNQQSAGANTSAHFVRVCVCVCVYQAHSDRTGGIGGPAYTWAYHN